MLAVRVIQEQAIHVDAVKTVALDCRRLLCPLPVIRVQDRVAELATVTLVETFCTDPGALQDIPAWCRINRHEVLQSSSVDGEYRVVPRANAPRE